ALRSGVAECGAPGAEGSGVLGEDVLGARRSALPRSAGASSGLAPCDSSASPPTPLAFSLTSPGSRTLPDKAAVRSRATFARSRKSKAKQVSTTSPYFPSQLLLSFWWSSKTCEPQAYQSFLPMVLRP